MPMPMHLANPLPFLNRNTNVKGFTFLPFSVLCVGDDSLILYPSRGFGAGLSLALKSRINQLHRKEPSRSQTLDAEQILHAELSNRRHQLMESSHSVSSVMDGTAHELKFPAY